MELKRTTTIEKKIGEHTFFIRPFGAFLSSRLSGELVSLIGPIIGSMLPALDDKKISPSDVNSYADFMDMDIGGMSPYVSKALATLSGSKIEAMCKELLVVHGNITVRGPVTNYEALILTEELADEIFCEEIQDMYALCIAVIKRNFKGFFKKLGLQSGNLQEILARLTNKNAPNTENLTEEPSATSN